MHKGRRLFTTVSALAVACYSDSGGLGCGTECFVAGTKIATPLGPRPIEELAVGDEVLSFDESERRIVVRRVTMLHRARAREARTVRGAGFTVAGATRAHPFWIAGRGWTPLENVRANDTLLLLQEGIAIAARVDSVESTELAAPDLEVFNLTVEAPLSNYFADGVLVHNKSPPVPYERIGIDVIDGGDLGDGPAREDAPKPPPPSPPPYSLDASCPVVGLGDQQFAAGGPSCNTCVRGSCCDLATACLQAEVDGSVYLGDGGLTECGNRVLCFYDQCADAKDAGGCQIEKCDPLFDDGINDAATAFLRCTYGPTPGVPVKGTCSHRYQDGGVLCVP